jgi:multidrug resistance efflux pump
MEKLPHIPSPPGAAFREFRIAVVPGLVFAAVLVLAILTWRNYVGPSQLVGEVEAIRSLVSAPQAGQILDLRVSFLQRVSQGEILAILHPSDPRALAAKLELSRSRLELLRESLDARLRQQNNDISYLQLRLDWMSQRTELASLKAQQAYFRSELTRQEQLMNFRQQPASPSTEASPAQVPSSRSPISVAEYQIAQRDLDSLNAQIEERGRLVQELEEGITRLQPEERRLEVEIPSAVKVALDFEEKELQLLETQVKPLSVVAPMDGVVSSILRRSGENVVVGEALFTLSGDRPERVIAYLRQPLNLELRTNMAVEIRSRALHHDAGLGRILAVGTQLEPILPQLLPRGTASNTLEYGLPVLVSLPVGLRVVGGEVVDLYPSDN